MESSSLVDYIMATRDKASPTGEHLRELGKKAAVAYTEQQRPLNETIAGLAKEAGLNHEQVKRVCEFANNEAFVSRFRAQPDARQISFPLADASVVCQTVSVAPMSKTASAVAPAWARSERYIPGQDSVSLDAAFGAHSLVKEAEAPPEQSASTRTRQFQALNGQHRNARSDLEVLHTAFTLKLAAIKTAAWNSQASGDPSWAVAAAVERARPSKQVYAILQRELGTLAPNGLQKMAAEGFEMAEEDPMTGLVTDLESIGQKLVDSQDVVMRTKAAIDELLLFLAGPTETSPTADLFRASPVPPPLAAPPPGAMPPGMPQQGPPPAGPPQGAPPQ